MEIKHKRTLIGLLIASLVSIIGYKGYVLGQPPGKDKKCDPVDPSRRDEVASTRAIIESNSLTWKQRGGTVNDASCVDETAVYGVVSVRSEEDVREALRFAEENNLKVTAAGVQHSMGGHAFSKGNLMLDMTTLNDITLHADESTVTVGSGATWHDIQNVLHPKFAVMSMQSTDIFSVGGSISVNAHGMDHQSGAVENSIVSMRVMLPTGEVHTLSRTENTELYNAVVGGYGLVGVILDAKLRVVPNDIYASSRRVIDYTEFPELFSGEITQNKNIGLTYTHLSTAPGDSFLREGIVYLYTRSETGADVVAPPLGEVSGVWMRRIMMNVSKYGGFAQTLKWWSEKYLEPRMESCSVSRLNAQVSGEACLVARNEPMHDSVPYLKNSVPKETDILHEYFIPRDHLVSFIDGMREIFLTHEGNLLNASIRVVGKERGVLTYAPHEAFSVVLYINQETTPEGHARMAALTSDLIDLSTREGGRFFLPYQLYYDKVQLRTAYPEIDAFFELKKKYDPRGLLTNTWYEQYGT